MDEEITIINTNTRNERIKIFFTSNKKNLIIVFSIIALLTIGYFAFEDIKKKDRIKLANKFNSAKIAFTLGQEEKIIKDLTYIVNKQDTTYSPLALHFLIDNKLINNNDEMNILFDVLIKETRLEKEIKNLIIYKKALFNSNFVSENELIEILSPIINSESIWKSHSLYLIAEYFYSKNERQKAREFFNKILSLQNVNNDIKLESQKRINRDLSE